MLGKAPQPPANRVAGRVGTLVAAIAICLLSIAAVLTTEAGAATPTVGALGAVAQTTAQGLTASTSATVAHVADSTTAPSQGAPDNRVSAVASTPATQPVISTNLPAAPTPAQSGIDVGSTVHEVIQRVAPASATGATGAIVHTATSVVTGLTATRPLAQVVQRVTSSPATTIVQDVAHGVTPTVTHTVNPPGGVRSLAGDPSRSAPARKIDPRAGARDAAPTSGATSALPAPSAGSGQSATARADLMTAMGLAQDGQYLPEDSLASMPPTDALAPIATMAAVERPAIDLSLPRGNSAASSPAHGGRPAPPPANPAPTPSPGGVSPTAAVGAGMGFAFALALAALLMMVAPTATRRLGLDGRSWRLAPLVLIADRPG